jgi:aldose 1-epimerase
VGGIDVVEPRAAGGAGRFCAGRVLFPWPNRVRGARWLQDGVERRLDVTEPERGHANHGLVLGAPFRVESRAAGAVRVSALVGPAPGYPFALRLVVRYAVDDEGLAVRYEVTNVGDLPAPVAIGAHPYLRVGDVPTEELTLELPAVGRFTLDEALIPVAEGPLTGEHAALPTGMPLGERTLNECYVRAAGWSPACVVAPDGAAVELDADDDFAFLQVFVCDDFPRAAGPARAIAVEPMTAPPDALNSGRGLRWLDPGEDWALGWRLRYRPA